MPVNAALEEVMEVDNSIVDLRTILLTKKRVCLKLKTCVIWNMSVFDLCSIDS